MIDVGKVKKQVLEKKQFEFFERCFIDLASEDILKLRELCLPFGILRVLLERIVACHCFGSLASINSNTLCCWN